MNRRGEGGSVLPLVAICLAVLMGFGGMGIDVGYWEYNQREQQNAADAAAVAGAWQLVFNGCPDKADALAAAKKDSADNGFTDSTNGVSVTVQNPPSSGPFSGNNCAVQAQVASTQVPTFLTNVLGFTNMSETTQATAQVVDDNSACFYSLNPSANTNFNSSTVVAPNCSMFINGSANTNGANVNVASFGEGNYNGSNNSGTFASGSPKSMLPVADPCPEIAPCAYLTNNPPATSPCNGTYAGNGTLAPGCYNNLNLNGANVTLQPTSTNSVFVFAGSTNTNNATLNGTGVTIYIPSGASTNFNKTSLNLTAPTTGSNAGVTFFQVSGNTSTVNFNTSNTDVGGMIYAPSAMMNYNSTSTTYNLVVAAYVNLNGSYTFASPPAGQTLVKNVVLTQ